MEAPNMQNSNSWQAPGVTKTDLARALPSIMLMRAGFDCQPHPLAEEISERCNLASMAAWLADRSFNPQDNEGILKSFRAGVGSIQFGDALEKVGREIIRQSFGRKAHVGLIARAMPQRDFQPVTRSAVKVGRVAGEQQENSEVPLLVATSHSLQFGKLRTFLDAVFLRREDLINDDAEIVAQLFSEAAHRLGTREWDAVLDKLEANANEPELDAPTGTARPYFGTDDGNQIGPGALTTTALTAAIKALRLQPGGDGKPMGLAPARLVVNPDLELPARKLLKEVELGDVSIVVAARELDSWYLMADPRNYAAIGLRFVGMVGSPIRTWTIHKLNRRAMGPLYSDGAGFHIEQSFAAELLSRRGIVRVPLS